MNLKLMGLWTLGGTVCFFAFMGILAIAARTDGAGFLKSMLEGLGYGVIIAAAAFAIRNFVGKGSRGPA